MMHNVATFFGAVYAGMTLDIILVFALLAGALILFISGWLRMDLVALMIMALLPILGLVSATDAISGFSNPAVITVWAMFIISEGLTRAGIADQIGRRVMAMAGHGEARLIAVFMLVSGTLSAFMNNIGVAALMLPVAIKAARMSGIAPSRLLMPMSYGTLLGGLMTLIGTPPNLLVSTALGEVRGSGFGFFDFAWIGLPVLLIGTAFVALVGRHLLPRTDTTSATQGQSSLRNQYGLQERIFALRVPGESLLAGKSIAESGLVTAAGLVIIALIRKGRTQALPHRSTALESGDILLAQGRFEHFQRLRNWSTLSIEREAPILHERLLANNLLAELAVDEQAPVCGEKLHHQSFRERFGVNVLAIRRDDEITRTYLGEMVLQAGDRLLVQGPPKTLASLPTSRAFAAITPLEAEQARANYQLLESLFVLRVPPDSSLAGSTLAENRLGDAFDFRLLGLFREGQVLENPGSEEVIQEGDLLLIQGRESDLDMLRGLQQLERLDDASPYLEVFDRGELELLEATPHPHSKLVGKRIDELGLDEQYQVEVTAIWRGGRPYRSGLRAMVLQAGDGLLIAGPRQRLAELNRLEDLIILNPVRVEQVDARKAPLAAGIMALVILPVLLGWLPITIAAVAGACLMVLSGCLNMEQAHRAIDWRAIFLIAGILPLGIAMQDSGAATWLASQALALLSGWGPWPVIAGLYLLTVLGTLAVPTVALVLVMSPIALTLSTELGIAPETAMMAVAIAATSLASPVSHPANILVMGPGGYRFTDYLKLGLPLTLIVFLLSVLLLPLFWPL